VVTEMSIPMHLTRDDRGLVHVPWNISAINSAAGEIAVNNDLEYTKNSTKFLYYTAHEYSLKITERLLIF